VVEALGLLRCSPAKRVKDLDVVSESDLSEIEDADGR